MYITGDSPDSFANSVGPHANLGETACMLALRPELVHMERAVDDPELKVCFQYRSEQVSRTGIRGRPLGATAEKGEFVFAKTVAALAEWAHRALEEEPPGLA